MFKHIKVSTASVLIIVGSILAVYSIPRDKINQWSAGTDALGLTLQTDGALVGQVDNANDLGSSDIEFKDGYFNGTVYCDGIALDGTVTGDLSVIGDIRVSSIFGFGSAEAVTVSTVGAIVPTSSYIVLRTTDPDGGGAVTMSAKPFITATNFEIGDFLIITTTGTTVFTLTEGDDYYLQLGGGTRALGQYDSIMLVYSSTATVPTALNSGFQEVSFTNN